jgi:WD40 repeat protein
VGELDGFSFFSMKLVEGITLQQLFPEDPPGTSGCRHVAAIMIKVSQAIYHAHQRGVLHRDLKPSNVLLDREHEPHVSDFGLARHIADDSSLTLTSALIGTPAYLAPEVAIGGGREATVASDIYGLGAILYFLLTGRVPFPGATVVETLRSVQDETPERPWSLNPNLPADLEIICLKCLEKGPLLRYATALQLADDLGRFLQGEPISARPAGAASKAWRWCRRKPAVAGLVAALLLALTLGLSGVVWQWWRAEFNAVNEASARHRAELGELAARQRQYVSDMNLVPYAWDEGDLQVAQERLRSHLPGTGEIDLRGFEWRYLWTLCQDESSCVFSNFTGEVSSIARSPDGKILAASSGQKVTLLDLQSRGELGELRSPARSITCVAFSPVSNDVLATGSAGGGISLWSIASKSIVTSLAINQDPISAFAFSPDGSALASTCGTNLSLWSLKKNEFIWTRSTPFPSPTVAFSPDGKFLVSGGGEKPKLKVWAVATGKEERGFIAEHHGNLSKALFAPKGDLLATTAGDFKLVLWDFAARRRLAEFPCQFGASPVAFSPDGKLVAVASAAQAISVYDVATGRRTTFLHGHIGRVNALAFGAESNLLISGSSDHTVRLWDLGLAGRRNILEGHQDAVASVAISPNRKLLASTDFFYPYSVKVWELPSQRLVTNLIGHSQAVVQAAFTPDGRLLATGSFDHTVRLWDAATLQLRAILTNDFEAGKISFSPEGHTLAVAGFVGPELYQPGLEKSDRLVFWDTVTCKPVNELSQAAAGASIVAFSNDGRLLATSHFDGAIRLWNYRQKRQIAFFPGEHAYLWSLTFSSDGALLACGEDGGTVVIYDVAAQRVLRRLKAHARRAWSVAFSPDGRTLASAGDREIKLWFVTSKSPDPVLTLRAGEAGVYCLTFSQDGNLLASCGADALVRLWPAASFAEIAERMPDRLLRTVPRRSANSW